MFDELTGLGLTVVIVVVSLLVLIIAFFAMCSTFLCQSTRRPCVCQDRRRQAKSRHQWWRLGHPRVPHNHLGRFAHDGHRY